MGWLDNYLARLRSQFPGYVLVIVEGGWFSVYDQDAEVMHRLLNWKMFNQQGHKKSGCPKETFNIFNSLQANGYAYKLLYNGNMVAETYDPPDPNAALNAAKDLPDDVVRIGSKVTVSIDGGVEEVYVIGEESNISENVISYETPIAKALLGRRNGEMVVAKVPVGDLHIEILKLEN